MKQPSLFTICLTLFAIVSCTQNDSDISSEWVKSKPISDSELHVKQGDCLSFLDSTGNYFIGTIVNFNKSEGGIWYAVCFTNYYDSVRPPVSVLDTIKLDMYKVMFYSTTKYKIGYYVTWVRDTLVDKHLISALGNPNIPEIQKLEVLGEGSSTNYSDYLASFNFFKDRRLLTQQYNKHPLDSAFHPDTLISFKGTIDAVINNDKAKSNR